MRFIIFYLEKSINEVKMEKKENLEYNGEFYEVLADSKNIMSKK